MVNSEKFLDKFLDFVDAFKEAMAIFGLCCFAFFLGLALVPLIKSIGYDPAYNDGFEAGRASQLHDCQNKYDCSYHR